MHVNRFHAPLEIASFMHFCEHHILSIYKIAVCPNVNPCGFFSTFFGFRLHLKAAALLASIDKFRDSGDSEGLKSLVTSGKILKLGVKDVNQVSSDWGANSAAISHVNTSSLPGDPSGGQGHWCDGGQQVCTSGRTCACAIICPTLCCVCARVCLLC